MAGQLTRHGIVAGGVSAAYALEALRLLEERASERGVQLPAYRFWQVGTPFPFPERTCAEFTKGLTDVLVLEELDHVLEDELLAFAGRTHAEYNTHGKLTGEARDRGENDVDDILARLAVYLGVPELAETDAPGILRSRPTPSSLCRCARRCCAPVARIVAASTP